MSNIKSQYDQAQARLKRAMNALEGAKEERIGFFQYLAATKQTEKAARAKRGKKDPQEVKEAEQAREGATAALQDADRNLRSAIEALAAAQKAHEDLKQRYEQWLDGENKREAQDERRQEEAKRLEELRRKRTEAKARRAQAEEDRQQRQQQESKSNDGNKGKRPPPQEPATPQAPKTAKTVRYITPQKIADWHKATVTAFLDKPSMRSFSEPPYEPCRNPACVAETKSRVLKACKCNIRVAFKKRTASELKRDRNKFHPDRLSSVPADVRERVQTAAREVFVVVDAMHNGH